MAIAATPGLAGGLSIYMGLIYVQAYEIWAILHGSPQYPQLDAIVT